MPQLGEIKKAEEIGLKGRYLYIWVSCPQCGKERWILKSRKPSLCKQCNGRLTINNYLIQKRSQSKSINVRLGKGILRGEDHPRWKGGRRKTKHGYITVRLQPNDSYYNMADTAGILFEHRLVMARRLGRCLLPQEKVHHIDGIKDHNDDSNLELITMENHNLKTAFCKNCPVRTKIKILYSEVAELQKALQFKLRETG